MTAGNASEPSAETASSAGWLDRIIRWIGYLRPPVIHYAAWEQILMRGLFAVLVLMNVPDLSKFSAQPKPNGLARVFGWDFTWLADPGVLGRLRLVGLPQLVDFSGVGVILWIMIVAAILYTIGLLPWLSTGFLLAVSVAVGTLRNSQGAINHQDQMMCYVLLAQWIVALWALGFHRSAALFRLPREQRPDGRTWGDWMIFASLQAIAACYVIAGLIKLINTDGRWPLQLPNLAVQLVKSSEQEFYNWLRPVANPVSDATTQLVIHHPWLAIVLFVPGLVVELGAFLALYSRVHALVVGVGCLGLHLLADWMMNLAFPENMQIVTIFLIAPWFWVAWAMSRFRRPSRQ